MCVCEFVCVCVCVCVSVCVCVCMLLCACEYIIARFVRETERERLRQSVCVYVSTCGQNFTACSPAKCPLQSVHPGIGRISKFVDTAVLDTLVLHTLNPTKKED